MRTTISAWLLIIGLTTGASSPASELDVAAVRLQQQEIDIAVAPIKSRADLRRHLRTATNSPLAKLPPHSRRAFLDSLVFTPTGLGSYSWLPLSGTLSVSDTWKLLSLFGVQSSVAEIPGIAPATEVEQHMVEVAPMLRHDWGNKICVIYDEGNYVCERQYGAACSRACD